MGKYKILLFKDECISCGACAVICPDFWEIDDEGMAHLKNSKKIEDHLELEINSEDDRAINQEAAEACPVQIIKIEKLE
jgi:ferredoxin